MDDRYIGTYSWQNDASDQRKDSTIHILCLSQKRGSMETVTMNDSSKELSSIMSEDSSIADSSHQQCVSFDDRRPIQHPSSFDFEDLPRDDIWYSDKELEEEAKAQRKWARKLYKQDSRLSLELVRGLEDCLSLEMSREVKNKIDLCVSLVVEEQGRQRSQGITDVNRLRKKSRKISKNCQASAFSLARHDAKVAKKVHKEGRQATRKIEAVTAPSSPVSVTAMF